MARMESISADSAHPQTQIIQKLEQQLIQQLLDELSRIQSSVSGEQERSQQLQQEMGRRLQEKQQTIKAQREQIIHISTNTPTKEVEVTVVASAPAPEPKPKRVVLDSSSASERRPEPVPEKKQSLSVTANALRRNPSIKKEIGRELEQAATKNLEDLGVKPNQSDVKNREFTSIMAKVHSKQDQVAKGMPEYWRCREEITRSLDEKMSERMMREAPPETQAQSSHAVQGRQSKTPQPAPRAKSTSQPKTSTPNSKAAPRTFTLICRDTETRMAKWIRGTSKKEELEIAGCG